MNIYDIARMAGVSTATVSRVINGGKVSEKTKERVQAVLKETGYQPSPYAQAMNSCSTRLIGILVADLTDLFYLRAVSALEEEFRKAGYDIILYSTDKGLEDIDRYLDSFISRRVDAVFTVGSVFHKAAHKLRTDGSIPVITVNLKTDAPGVYHVFCEDEKAVADAVHTLFARGHRKFLYINDADTVSGSAKLAGFFRGIAECGLPSGAALLSDCERDISAATQKVKSLLTSHPNVSAVLTSVDELAAGAVKAALALGKKIPEELAIVGYDNSILSECSTPRISSIDSRVDDMCRLGIKLFFDLQNGKAAPVYNPLECRLVEKETT